MTLVLDASVVFKLLVPKSRSDKASILVDEVSIRGELFAAPVLLPFEIVNTILKCVRRSGLPQTEARQVWDRFEVLDIEIASTSMHARA